MSSIQDKYRRFRQWQENPFDYQDSADRHVCCNCGGEADNNYCPRCGQKAVYGPITWSSVWQGIMDVWGVGTRSLPYSLWQLIWRPGYMIRDYISGKRQVSFPPVKMLVVVALMLVLVNTLLGVDYSNSNTTVNHGSAAFNAKIDVLFDWMTNHIAWTVLMAFSLFIVPVWFLFRQAPRLPRHTLPQGFYIQVLIGVQYLMFMLMVVLLIVLLPSLSGNDGSDATGFMVTLVLPIMLLVDYKQLFGYGWWGTLWRVLLCGLLSLLICKLLIAAGGHGMCQILGNPLGLHIGDCTVALFAVVRVLRNDLKNCLHFGFIRDLQGFPDVDVGIVLLPAAVEADVDLALPVSSMIPPVDVHRFRVVFFPRRFQASLPGTVRTFAGCRRD